MTIVSNIANYLLLFSSLGFVGIAFSQALTAQDINSYIIAMLFLGACQTTFAFANFFKSLSHKSWTFIQISVFLITLSQVAMTVLSYTGTNQFITEAGQNYSTDLQQQINFSASIRNNIQTINYCAIANCSIQLVSAFVVIVSQLTSKDQTPMDKKLVEESTDYESQAPSTDNSPKKSIKN